MSETFTLTMEGLAELQTTLRQLPDATARNVMRRVLLQAAAPIADAAAARAPVRTTALKISITESTRLSTNQRREYRKADPNDVEVYVGAGALPQAHLQEYGTSTNPAQPFMRPAWDMQKEGAFHSIKDLLWKEIEKAVQRRARKAAKAVKG